MNVPLLLTVTRLLAIPVFGIIYYLPFQLAHLTAAIVFLIAAFTDWLDGYLARTLKQVTAFGTFLDPVADKLLVSVALVIVVGELYVPYLAIPAAIIICREILISALREWMAEIGKRSSVVVTFLAKVKAGMQVIASILLIWYSPGASRIILWLGVILLWVAAALTVWTMLVYLRIAWPDLTTSHERQ